MVPNDFDFSVNSLNVTDYVPYPDPQTDFTPPSLVSVKFDQEKVSYNEKFSVNYEALETGSEFDGMEIVFVTLKMEVPFMFMIMTTTELPKQA